MANPLNEIIGLLDIVGKRIKVLPATGGAVEELQRPDLDEIDDKIVNEEDELIDTFAEEPEPTPTQLCRYTPPIYRKEKHLFRFFIDGSLRTYFLGTGIEGRRSFPIELSQIGATVIQREENGTIKTLEYKNKIVLLLPKQQKGVSDTLWEEIAKIYKPAWLEVIDYTLPDIFSDKKSDPRDKAGAKARKLMHDLEIELIKSTDNLRNENNWLILDGAIKFVEKDIWETFKKVPYVIAVAKSFRKDPIFKLGSRRSQHIDLTQLLARLPHAYRTAAFRSQDRKVAFWYVRIREQKEVDYPLMGVIKVEYPTPDGKPIPTELADLLSKALVAERNVTPYGSYRRWHCSLYPIYIAEQVIKTKFYSKEVLMGSIKWPKPTINGGV